MQKKETESTEKSFNAPLMSLDDVPKVTVKHVLAATSAMLGNPVVERIRKLQMSAKLVLCTVVLMMERKMKDMAIRKVYSMRE